MPAATAAPDPPDEPPGVRVTSHGLRAGAQRMGSVTPLAPNSGVLVLPRLTIPAASIESVTPSETWGTKSRNASDPNVVGTPAVRFRSLIAVGTPRSGPSPGGTAAARSRACATVVVTNAPTSSSRSTRSR